MGKINSISARPNILSHATLPLLYHLCDPCSSYHTHTVLHCRVLAYADSSLQKCYGKTSWVRMCGKNWGIGHQFSFSKKDFNFFPFIVLLSPLCVSVFIWGCPHFATWRHLETPKLSQNNWSLEQEEDDPVQESSPWEPKSTALLMHFTISKTYAHPYSSTWELDIL